MTRADEGKQVRMMIAVGVSLSIIVIAIVYLFVADIRTSEALIEKPMIKVFSTLPSSKTI